MCVCVRVWVMVCVCCGVRARVSLRSGARMQVLLACADSSLKAGILRSLRGRIDRIVHYASVYDKVMRAKRRETRERRKSTFAKVMAAVVRYGSGGTVRCHAWYRRMERVGSGSVSAVASVHEMAEGAEIVWESCVGDMNVYVTHDGHGVSLRSVLEMEILNYEQGAPTKGSRVEPSGRKVAAAVPMVDCKITKEVEDATGEAPCRKPQAKYNVKVTFDSRQISKTKAQTEVMLLLIPDGVDGQEYCQSAMRIRTVLVYTGKDGKEQLQANMERVLQDIEDVRERGLRYSQENDAYLGQDPDAELKPGDRQVAVEFLMPADMCALFGLFGHGGGRDPHECFCTHCHCKLNERHRPFSLVRLEKDSTVGDVCRQHGLKVQTFWALNAGNDPSGQFGSEELTDASLFKKTKPEPLCSQPAATSQEAPSTSQATVGEKR